MKLTKQQKTGIAVLGVVIASVVAYKIFVPKTDNNGSGNSNDTGAKDFDPAKVSNILYNAMRYTGTDEAAIVTALKPLSAAQFNAVIEKFGYKFYNKTMGNTTEYLWNKLHKYGLKVWLKNELSDDEYELLRLKFPKIL